MAKTKWRLRNFVRRLVGALHHIFYLLSIISYLNKNRGAGLSPCAPYKWVVYQPFRPLDATPCTKYFCRERNTISTGISAMTEAAMIRPYSAEYWLMNMRRPIWMVFSSVLVR